MSLSTPYFDNSSTPITNQDVGIKISQPGFNAQTASPTQLIFDSSWPAMPVAYTSGAVPLTTSSSYTVSHNLGFAPFTRIFILDADKNIIQNVSGSIGNYVIDTTKVYLFGVNGVGAVQGSYFYVECYNIDLSIDVDYPSLPTTDVKNIYDDNFGIKITKEKKDANSTDGRDYILHSRYRSPLIKAIKTEVTENSSNILIANALGKGGAIQYTNTDGEQSWITGFVKIGETEAASNDVPVGSYEYAPLWGNTYYGVNTDGITSYLEWNSDDQGATLVILRDPFFAPTTNQVIY